MCRALKRFNKNRMISYYIFILLSPMSFTDMLPLYDYNMNQISLVNKKLSLY